MRNQDRMRAWHTRQLRDLLEEFQTQSLGLQQAQAATRLIEHGPNRLPESPPRSLWHILLSQFRSPLIYILGLAAIVSVMIGDTKDAVFIAVVLAINAAIGCYQEWRAEQSS